MSENIVPYNATKQSQRVIDQFPIRGKLISYEHSAEFDQYTIHIESIGKTPKDTTILFFRDTKNFTTILDIMSTNYSTVIAQCGDSTDSIEQPDGT